MTGLNVTTSTNGLVLGSAASNPVSISAGVYVTNGAGDALGSSLTSINWTIGNSGTIRATGTAGDGIDLASGAAITNSTAGRIAGYQAGVLLGGSGTLVNSGRISNSETAGFGYGYNAGTFSPHDGAAILSAGGMVTNTTSALISGYHEGVGIGAAAGTVVNAGTIAGNATTHSMGVFLAAGGFVSNASTGTINGGSYGILATAAPGTVTNQGLIGGGEFGVLLNAGGRISNTNGGAITGGYAGLEVGNAILTNAAGGTVSGGTFGVFLAQGSATVTNAGSIGGTNNSGMLLTGADTITNQSNGVINGGIRGIWSYGTSAVSITNLLGGTIIGASLGLLADGNGFTALNSGLLKGGTGVGVVLFGSAAVTNATSGQIIGGLDAIYSGTSAASVIIFNAGTMTAGTSTGALMLDGGRLTNALTGTITAPGVGVEIVNAAGSVLNAGTIIASQATGAAGIFLVAGGYVDNTASGVIRSPGAGVVVGRYSTSSIGTIVNAGTIVAGNSTFGGGLYLFGANTVSNASSGSIVGGRYGVYASGSAPSSVVNSGILTGTVADGVFLGAGGNVTNNAGGAIYGQQFGVLVKKTQGTVFNAGHIAAALTNASDGVQLKAGGNVTNALGGTIAGLYFGVEVVNGIGTVFNTGTLLSEQTFYGAGVQLGSGGSVTNGAGGYIRAQWIGVQIGTNGSVAVPGTVVNNGTIVATDGTNGAAIWITGPGSIYNGASGTIAGGPYGIVAYNQVTVVNRGFIGGSQHGFDAVAAGFADRIVAEPGATFGGIFSGGNRYGAAVTSTLELGAGSLGPGVTRGVAGTLSGIGSQFVDFGQIFIDPGANWTLGGQVAAGQTIAFGGSYASLTLLNPGSVSGTIVRFGASDTIVLSGITSTSGLSFSGDTLVVNQSAGPALDFLFAAPETLGFAVAGGSTKITVACFVEGTRIETEDGAVAVEALRPGTLVRSFFGHNRKIVWIGHRHIDCTKHPRPKAVWPIEIEAEAFGPGLPAANLRVSPDHAIYVNEVLIPARCLVNGTTIRQVPVNEVTYYHVELPRHDVLLAEGLPAESYLDTGDRSSFTGGMPIGLCPDFAAPGTDWAAIWEAYGCAPLVIYGEVLEAVRAMVNRRVKAAA